MKDIVMSQINKKLVILFFDKSGKHSLYPREQIVRDLTWRLIGRGRKWIEWAMLPISDNNQASLVYKLLSV